MPPTAKCLPEKSKLRKAFLPVTKLRNAFPVLIFAIFFFSFPGVSVSHASAVIELDADTQFSYAEHCREAGEYQRAVDEYKRFVWFFPDDPRKDLAIFNIGKALFDNRDYRKAIEAFGPLTEKGPGADFFADACFMIAECHVRQNAPAAALSVLRNLIGLSGDTDTIDEARYRIGWIYLDAGIWDAASEHFAQIGPENLEKYKLRTISEELGKTAAIPKKSPAAAGVLSIVPGAGYLYCGRYRDAATSFIVNGGLMFGAARAFKDDNHALGGLAALVGLGFYTGNIYGSIAGAHKYNRNSTNRFIDNLKKKTRLALTSNPKRNSLVLSIRFEF